jgi:hypothetical protein
MAKKKDYNKEGEAPTKKYGVQRKKIYEIPLYPGTQ